MGYSVNGYGIGDLVKAVNAVGDKAVDRLCDEYEQLYTVATELRKGGVRTNHCARRRASNSGCAHF